MGLDPWKKHDVKSTEVNHTIWIQLTRFQGVEQKVEKNDAPLKKVSPEALYSLVVHTSTHNKTPPFCTSFWVL